MKRIIICLFLLLSFAESYAFKVTNSDGVDIKYMILTKGLTGTVTVLSAELDEHKGTLRIPEDVTYEGIRYYVTEIHKNAFQENLYLDSLFISDRLVSIGNDAFNGSSVVFISDLNGVEKIGEDAFRGTRLEKIHFGKSVKIIGNNAFQNCPHLYEVMIFGDIESYGEESFSGCPITKVFVNPDVVAKLGLPDNFKKALMDEQERKKFFDSIMKDDQYFAGLKCDFSEIVNTDVPKVKCFGRLKEWVAKNFGNYKSVVQLEDNENCKLVAKGCSKVSKFDNDLISFTMTMECKDGRYRCYYSDVKYETHNSDGLISSSYTLEQDVLSLKKTRTDYIKNGLDFGTPYGIYIVDKASEEGYRYSRIQESLESSLSSLRTYLATDDSF